jgi:5'(3')-deoxyribonucleotidase
MDYCFDHMDGLCGRTACRFRHDLPETGSEEYRRAQARKKIFLTRKTKPIMYIDMDGVLVDFMSGVAKLDEETYKKYAPHFDHVPGIFHWKMMDPMPGAIEAYKTLMKIYTVRFLTKPSNNNSSCYTDKCDWIAHYMGPFHTQFLIINPFKEYMIGDILIDDRDVPGFMGKQIRFGSKEFPDWPTVLAYLIPR